ncbi:MAG: cytochrome c oxidase subunit II [Nanoarchaeota archaeon]|nr:cytochrome c oxidase subunit II [Nanoarchaeota archaeon]
MEIDNLSLDELKKIDTTTLPERERKLLKKRKKFLKKQNRREEDNRVIINNEEKRKKKTFITYSIILVVSLFAGYFLYSTVKSPTGNVVENFELTGETKEFTMTARQWKFIPNTITIDQGDKVILNIKSVDVTHGFAVPQFGIDARLIPGKNARVEFVADKKGSFPFVCSVVCGAGHSGMRGKIVVE